MQILSTIQDGTKTSNTYSKIFVLLLIYEQILTVILKIMTLVYSGAPIIIFINIRRKGVIVYKFHFFINKFT